MSTLKQQVAGDPIINAVLDQITDVGQIDASSILPNYKLGSDLGLSRAQIQSVVENAARALELPIALEQYKVEDTTAKQLVDLFRHWSISVGRAA